MKYDVAATKRNIEKNSGIVDSPRQLNDNQT
jgi:hypothetical protein